jgi:DNA primase
LRISDRSIEEVREAANIVEVASEFTALRRQGTRFAGLCPYPDHSEKTPSFSVSPDRGFYYCFGCLEANERIWTSRGLIPIAAAEPGDEVIGLDGRRETITDKWFKSAPTVRIATGAAKEGIELTPDHTCLYIAREEALRSLSGVYLRSTDQKAMRFSRKLRRKDAGVRITVGPASDIREGDFWLYPLIPDEERNDTPLPGERVIRPYTKGPRTPRISSLPVNPRTAWLYGVWLAQGSIHRGGIKWSFSASEERTLARRVIRTLDEEFGRAATMFSRPERNLCEVTCSSTDLSLLFGHWFGRGCEHKRIPFETLNWSRECQAAMMDGYLDGDGHYADGIASAASVSEELMYGIFALCIQAGQVCSSSLAARMGKDGVHRRKCYYVHLLSKESLEGFFANINGVDYFLSMVQRVGEARDEPTTVVDITTTGSHSFLTKMGITHNCQRGGDAIKLVSELKNFSFVDAVSYLAERSGVELEFEGVADPEAARERNLRRRNIHRALAAAAVYYHKYLLKSRSPEAENARNYLKGRSFERSTIEEFRLGYAPPRGIGGFAGAAGKLGFERKVLDAAGLLSARGGERFSGRITFPISDRRGRIVGFGGRALGDDHPKYLNSPETEIFNKRDLLYGFPQVSDAMRKERAAIIVEGYTDVLMLYQSGIKNAVATLGTATTPSHLRTLSGYADKIYMLFDPDAAGEKALERADATVQELERAGDPDTVAATTKLKLDVRVLRLTEDPADWLREHRPEEFKEMLSGAVTLLEYLFRRKAERARGAGAAERSRMMSEIRSLIKRIDDPVFYRDALRIAAEVLGVSPREFQSGRREQLAPTAPSRASAAVSPHDQAGREVLALILAHPKLAAEPLKNGVRVAPLPEPFELRPGDFADETQADLFNLLREHPGEDLDSILSDERSRSLMNQIVALASEGERLFSSSDSFRAAWLRLAVLSRERVVRNAKNLDTSAEADADSVAWMRLYTELRALREALSAISAEP